MKQKQILSLLLCGVLLSGIATGCEKTPEKPIVREKGEHNIENYKEAEPTPESGRNALAERLQVPEKYEASATGGDGSFELTCNADVVVPDAAEIPIYRVGQKPFDQEWIDQVTKVFFGDAPIYDGDAYFQMTKAEALERLNQLKAWQAEGNLDPYGLIASAKEDGAENPEELFSLSDAIATWEQNYNECPDAKEKKAIAPAFGAQPQYGDRGNYFFGAAEIGDAIYSYRIREITSCPMDIRICRVDDQISRQVEWTPSLYNYDETELSENISIPPKEKAEEMAGITPEEAIEIADGYMEKLGLSNFSAKSTSLSLAQDMGSGYDFSMEANYTKAGYMVSYTRDVDGFPVTDEMNIGGALDSMESTLEPWSYERIEFYVNQEGLQRVDIFNLYQIEEQQVSNVELLSFPEIADIFEEMAAIHFSDFTAPNSAKVNVTKAELGYMRIYDPAADSRHGLLVPVWDFFGKIDYHHVYEGEANDYSVADPRQSILTINAADGTVIDRGLGY